MNSDVIRNPGHLEVKQFSIFADNKVGRLNDIVMLLASNDIHIMALATVDTTDSSILRLVVDYWEDARTLLKEHDYSFSISEVVVVEIATEQDIKKITCALTQTEINIHYIYPLLMRPQNRSGLVIRLEDNDLATDILNKSGLKTLIQTDIAR